jgi:hypothetical protein
VSLLVLLCCASTPAALVQAQDKTPAAKSGKHAPHNSAADKSKPKPKPRTKTKQSEPHAGQPPAESKPAAPPSAAASAVDDEDVHHEGGTDVKSVEFGGLDIEGQLKTPQMLYFLNRLRAEFDRPELPHRSFMPELQRSTREKDF